MLYLKARAGITTLTSWKNRKGSYAKVFLLNDQRNKNGWRVTWESIKKNASDFIGRPGIEYVKCEGTVCDLDHTDGTTYEQNLKVQEQYRVSTIVDYVLDEATHTAYAIHQINSKGFAKKLSQKLIRYVSPSIWPKHGAYEILGKNTDGRPLVDVYDWKAIHSAWVTKPAFGDDAKIVAQCDGTGHDCKLQLSASEEDPLGPLKEIPLLVRHKHKLLYVGINECVHNIIQNKADQGIKITDQELEAAYAECGGSKTGKERSCSPCEQKQKLAAKIKKLEKRIQNLQN